MEDNTLGLPLEYRTLPEFFDAQNTNENTDAKNGIIETLLRQNNVNSVLDLTCGTGSQVFFLANRGYQVTGADFSPALLEIAREKARLAQMDVTFLDGDMRTLHVGQFDAVITIFNAIGHLTKTGFEQAIQNVHRNLKDGGIYIFDIFNLEAITDTTIKDFDMEVRKTVNGTSIHHTQHSTIDREAGRLTSYDDYIIQRAGEEPQTYKAAFTLQIYTATDLQEMLARNGFDILAQYDMDGEAFLPHQSLNILTIAQKR